MLWFKSVGWLQKEVFSCFLKDVIVSAVRVDVGSTFHQRGTERVKVLASGFLHSCESTRRCHLFCDLSVNAFCSHHLYSTLSMHAIDLILNN